MSENKCNVTQKTGVEEMKQTGAKEKVDTNNER